MSINTSEDTLEKPDLALAPIETASQQDHAASQSQHASTDAPDTEKIGPTVFIDRISEQLQTLVLPFLQDSKTEAAAHIQRLIKTTLENQGLVTREMFDVQSELLAKTR